MQTKSKRKGKSLEDKVAELIRETFGVNQKFVQRADASGNKSTEVGDIDIFDPTIIKKFPFVIECKNREEWKMRDLIGYQKDNKTNPFLRYIEQNEKDVKKQNDFKYGLIVFSKQYEDIYQLVYDESLIERLKELDSYIITTLKNKKVLITTFKKLLEEGKHGKIV